MSIVVGDPRPAVRPFVPLSTTRTVCPPAALSLSPTYYDSDIHGDLYEVHSPLSPPRPSSRSLRSHLCCLDDLVLILGGSSHGSVRSFCLNELPRAMLCGVDHSDSHHCVRPHFTPSPGSRRASRSDWLVQGSRWADHDGTRRPITEQEYAQLSDQAMDTLHDSLEELVEGDEGAQGGWEVEYNVSLGLPAALSGACWRRSLGPECELKGSKMSECEREPPASSADALFVTRVSRPTRLPLVDLSRPSCVLLPLPLRSRTARRRVDLLPFCLSG